MATDAITNTKTETKVRLVSLPKPPDFIRTPLLAGALGYSLSFVMTYDAQIGFFTGLSLGLLWELGATEALRFSGGRRGSRRARSSRRAQALAYEIPSGRRGAKIDPEVGGFISRPFGEFFGRRKRTESLRPEPRPVFGSEVHFRSLGVELSGAVVETFLRSAERLRARGRGLSERRWSGENGEELPKIWRPIYYKPTMQLLYEAEDVLGRQLVIENAENGWKELAKTWRETYNILRYVESLKVYSPPRRASFLSSVFGN